DLSVVTADTVSKGVEEAEKDNFSLFLIDLRMPKESGFDALRKLKSVAPKTPMCILSSYLHLEDYQNRLKRLGVKVGVLDKDIPNPDHEAFKIFVDKLKDFINEPPKYTPKQFEKHVFDKELNPFDLSFKGYLNLPNRIKRYMRKKAREIAHEVIEKEFSRGKIWVLVCGSSQDIILSADSDSDIPSAESIMQAALDLDCAPYQFSAPDHVDDFWSGSCMGSPVNRGYPTVTLKLHKEVDADNFHFDTGCPATFLSFERLSELGLIEKNAMTTDGRRGSHEYEFISQPLQVKMIDQERTGNTSVLKFKVRAVKNWLSSPFIALCPHTCENYDSSGTDLKNCANRKGLIGRNMIQETKISLTINGSNNKTKFSKTGRAQNRRGQGFGGDS
ncbi:MAG: response regulator, partial [Cyanobacteria bacterium J06597_16]